MTVAEAQRKLEQYCSYQDRCHKEVEEKLASLSLIPEAKEKIIVHLIQQNYLNEERFAKSFARGKFRIKKWGRQRIIRELKFRKISEYLIKMALQEISETEYVQTFHELAEKKFDMIRESNVQKKKKKLINYLMYRGWESTLIYEKIHDLFIK